MSSEGLSKLLEEVERDVPARSRTVAYVDFPRGFYPSREDVARFQRIIEAGKVFEHFLPRVAPAVVGMREQKAALLLSMASLLDWGDSKNRIHVLFHGPTGTAKTQLAATVLRLGGGWSAVRSSQVGLTASGSGEEVEYGLLPMHNRGVVAIDELDKLSRHDQAGCLSAMEEGLVAIHVGKHHEILDAEVIVVATSNDPDRLTPELMDRFDFVLETPEPTVQDARVIIDARIRTWGYGRREPLEELGRYLAWVRSFEPDLDDKARELASREAQHLAREVQDRGVVRIRRLETLVRASLAHARLHRRDVTCEDVEAAANLVIGLTRRP